MASADEEEIRAATVARLRELMPGARIIHELNVAGQGSNRIDVAAVDRQAIVGVEIKSRKDTLKRLAEQWDAFSKCCHLVIIAAHERHFYEHRETHQRDDVPGEMRLPGIDAWRQREAVWRYPRPENGRYVWMRPWTFEPMKATRRQPRAHDMLSMLWAEELRTECARHLLASGTRRTRPDMIEEMVWTLTGREICEAVCRRLREREFTRADPPIQELRA